MREEAGFEREREKRWFLIKYILFPKHIFIPLLPRIILVQTISHCINLVFVFISSYSKIYLQKMKMQPKFSRIVSSTNKEKASGEI